MMTFFGGSEVAVMLLRFRKIWWQGVLITLAILVVIDGLSCEKKELPVANVLPSRIISLAPAVTEQLYLLGVEDKICGVTTFCDYPPEATKKEKIGSLLEVNYEKIFLLKPDLIIASADGVSPTILSKLRTQKYNLLVLPVSGGFDDIQKNFLMLARAVGKEKEARKILEDLANRLKKVKEKISGAPCLRVFCQVGSRPLVTAGKGTFIDEEISLAGGRNVVEKSGYLRYNMEEVILLNPDVILIATIGHTTLPAKLGREDEVEVGEWRKFESINAVKKWSYFCY